MRFPTWVKTILRDAALAFLGSTAISWFIVQVGMEAMIRAVQGGSRAATVLSLVLMLGSLILLQVAAFTLVARIKGGSRKSRSEYVRRVAVQFWILETIYRIVLIVLASIHPEFFGDSEGVGRMKTINVFGILVSYPLVMGFSTLGRNLSFRFVPAPEDQAY